MDRQADKHIKSIIRSFKKKLISKSDKDLPTNVECLGILYNHNYK